MSVQTGSQPASIGSATDSRDGRVVQDDDLAALAQPHVELHTIGAFGGRQIESLQRVFGRGVARSAVPQDERSFPALTPERRLQIRRPQLDSSAAIDRAMARALSRSLRANEMAPTTGCPPPP